MRTVTIDMSVDQQHPICSFGGYAGENKETKLVVILPERMLKGTYTKYRFDFQTILNEQISSTMIDHENLQGGNAVQVILWNQLMPQEGDLKFCVSAFEAAADGGADVVVQGKTALITLKIGKSVGGAYTPIDVKANADELQTMIQDTIDDTVGIKSAAQPEKSSAPSAGSKAYLITACDQTAKTFTLDGVYGLAVGDVYSITASGYANVEDVGKITAINGKVVTVDHLPVENGVGYGNAVPQSDALPENFPQGLASPYFRIIAKPTVGSQSIGTAALAGGISTEAQMDTSFATGKGSKSVGKYGVAMGNKNTAYYAAAAIGGGSNKAFGKNSAIIGGSSNKANGYADFILGGQNNETSGGAAFATGSWNKVPGFNAAAFGLYNESHGQNDFVTGYRNIVNGYCAAAFGDRNKNIGMSCLVAGQITSVGTKGFKIISATINTDGTGVFELDSVEGLVKGHAFSTIQDKNFDNWGTITAIDKSNNIVTVSKFTETTVPDDAVFIDLNNPNAGTQIVTTGAVGFGQANRAIGSGSIVAGESNTAYGKYAAIFGKLNSGVYGTLVAGRGNKALGLYSFAQGHGNSIDKQSDNSTALGQDNTISGSQNAAIGLVNTVTNARSSIAVGDTNKIVGTDSAAINSGIALGSSNTVTGHYGIAVGYNNKSGTQSYTAGANNVANVWLGFALGLGNKANYEKQVIVGTYNATQNAAFIVGNGTSDTSRSNAFVVNKDGSAEVGKQGTKDLSVATIKDLKEKLPSVDDTLSATSTNPVQNKVVYREFNRRTPYLLSSSNFDVATATPGWYCSTSMVQFTNGKLADPATDYYTAAITNGNSVVFSVMHYNNRAVVELLHGGFFNYYGGASIAQPKDNVLILDYDDGKELWYSTHYADLGTISEDYRAKDEINSSLDVTTPTIELNQPSSSQNKNIVYQYANTLTSLTITATSSAGEYLTLDQSIRLIFKATSSTTITVPSGLYFRGDDCNDSYVFIPQDNKVYDIIITYDGFNYNGIVVGTPATR